MLYIIGLGLNDERDIGERAKKAAEASVECYCELYTSKWFGSIPNLQAEIKNKIQIVNRKFLEEDSEKFIEKARKSKITLFVPGDPLCATTHINLIAEARQKKVKVKIIHNASIFSAIGETGLQLYKFGKTATVPFSGHTNSARDTLKLNKKSGLHTLLLLDLRAEEKTFMHPEVAIELLLHRKLLKNTDEILIASRLGKNSDIKFGTASELSRTKMDTPAVVIVPGKLHFAEREMIEFYRIKKRKGIKPEEVVKSVKKRLNKTIGKSRKLVKKTVGKKINKKISKYGKKISKKLNKKLKTVTRKKKTKRKTTKKKVTKKKTKRKR
jgi:diphthine methyl ester synthase